METTSFASQKYDGALAQDSAIIELIFKISKIWSMSWDKENERT